MHTPRSYLRVARTLALLAGPASLGACVFGTPGALCECVVSSPPPDAAVGTRLEADGAVVTYVTTSGACSGSQLDAGCRQTENAAGPQPPPELPVGCARVASCQRIV